MVVARYMRSLSGYEIPTKVVVDTPDVLANAVVDAMQGTVDDEWLDPSAGSGRLVEAVLRTGVRSASVTAMDLRTDIPNLLNLGVRTSLGTDFLAWASTTDRKFDRIILNPPYVRIAALEPSLRAQALLTRVNGGHPKGTSNYWVPFVAAALSLLKEAGSLGLILPAAWEYADYAEPLRRMCADSFAELDVHRATVPMFQEVMDGCIVVVGRGFGQRPTRPPRVNRHNGLTALADRLRRATGAESSGGTSTTRESVIAVGDEVTFDEIADVSIGAVTGDVSFFLMTEAQRVQRRLPRSAVRPALTRARHLDGSEITTQSWDRLLEHGERVWLFDPLDTSPSSVQDYLQASLDNGGVDRAARKVGERKPWYRVRIPDHFDGFVSGMRQALPWVALNRVPGLTATNTLYGVRFKDEVRPEDIPGWLLSMLSSRTLGAAQVLARLYPQGLQKLEPSDIKRLPIRRPPHGGAPTHAYRSAVRALLENGRDAAESIADAWLDERKS